MDRKQYRNIALIIAVFILVFGVGAASAQQAAKAKADNSGAANAQQVAIDGKGHFRALSNEEAAALANAMVKANNTSSEGLKPFSVANGMTGYDLEGRFENAEIVKINPDGTLSQACVKSREDAEKFLTAEPDNKPKPQTELETK